MDAIIKKKPGSALRDKVAAILSIVHRKVELEYPIGPTTADVYFIDQKSSKFQMKVAVECKDWAKSLNSTDLAEIEIKYYRAIDAGDINYLWIISNHELSQQPYDTLKKMKNVVHSTYQEFLSEIMNFSFLLEDNIASFKNDKSYKNFLHLNAIDREGTLEECTRKWIASEGRALLIYGGYGLGKTSFSLYLASTLSSEYQNGTFPRIPIRISLGKLFTKQDLMGLVCSVLTGSEGGASVGNFNYNLFLRMVEEGLFLIILDGFDEMRHAMSIAEFAFTFEKMAPLFEGNSKTIILGRPDSFFSEEEEERVFADLLSSIGSSDADLEKIQVSPLSEAQIISYLGNLCVDNSRSGFPKYEKREIDILSRPVQLWMYAKILKKYNNLPGELTRYRLYSEFIYEFVKREQSKPARMIDIGESSVGYSDPRSVFMQNVAWWVLVDKRENRFTPSELPRDLIPESLNIEGRSEGSLREALVGSVIERLAQYTEAVGTKGGAIYYFPHKSYLEFLVAGYFVQQTFSRERFAQFFRHANKDILSFVMDGPPEGASKIAQGIEFVRGPTLREFFRAASLHEDFDVSGAPQPLSRPTAPQIFALYERHLREGSDAQTIDDFIFEAFRTATKISTVYAVSLIASEHLNRQDRSALAKRLLVFAFNSLDQISLSKLYKEKRSDKINHISDESISSIRSIFISNCISVEALKIRISVNGVWAFAHDVGMRSFMVSDYDLDQSGCLSYEFGVDECAELGEVAKSVISKGDVARSSILVTGPLERYFGRI
ncbi:NACHT domain-containing protein [Rhizobium straminoryzae]|uniref:NACHT domain-containing protein n=1 Tax=Rhizobium straminoryzae TaxID=1387186 RepID=A0A549T818_9HYPH|nr:hypothetical protein [Rhizobium straminoryzae]TRL38005.1 hypothetical protein FNA46_13415 [Rhizobium straminoryzae]